MDALAALLGPLLALAVGAVAWTLARQWAPRPAANDNRPLRSRPTPLRATVRRAHEEAAMLSKGKGEAKRAAGLSVIGADVTVTGNITTDGDLHVDGAVEGDIACGSLVQGASSRIVGAVTARSARLAGTIEGTVSAAALTVEKSAKLRGDASYQTVQIETGAQVDGRMTHLDASQAAANDGPLRLIDRSDAG